VRLRASHSALNSASRSPTVSVDANWSSSSLQPRAATLRIESGPPAAIQTGGCGFCEVGGSTMMSSYCQNLPLCENPALDVQALMMTCSASSKRACACSYGVQKPADSEW
jgi:hypothetical protein